MAELPDGGTITVAGLEITVDHAPGHTRGSVLFRLPGTDEATLLVPGVRPAHGVAVEELCLSGDVLFAGSIGRTDLPGGSMEQMADSLRDRILPLADEHAGAARPRAGDHDRTGARDQPVPAGRGRAPDSKLRGW